MFSFGDHKRRRVGVCVALTTLVALAMLLVGIRTEAASNGSLSFPIRAAFFYPWFPEAWTQDGIYPYTNYHPSLGYYSDRDLSTVQQQVRAMQYGHIQAGIASWWGRGTQTDSKVPTLLQAAAGTGFKWTLYYEPAGQGAQTSSDIRSDLDYIYSKYASDSSYLHVNGKPVIFVFNTGANASCSAVNRWKQANGGRFYVSLKVFSGYRTCSSQPDTWHQYGPAVATDEQRGYSYSVSPGYWKVGESPGLSRSPSRFASNVASMVASREPWQLITTFNEWGEGTAVESASEWATSSGYGTYMDILHNDGTSPTPTPTPSPTATPTRTAGGVPAFDHVYLIVFENKEYGSIVGSSSAPYLNSLISQYGLATSYYATTHPSEPNYFALFSGSTQGATTDGTYNLSGHNLADQIGAKGRNWMVYAQNVPSGCYTGSSASGGEDGSGTYVRKHEPAISFTDISGSSTRCAHITDFTHFSPSAASFEMIVPNLCNDMHDCSVSTGDKWLSSWLPSHILGTSTFENTDSAVFITWDEGSTNTNGGGHIATIVISKHTPSGYRSSVVHNHYSLLRTIEDAWGLGCLNNTCNANDLSEFFR